ncbi:b(0,+)-type amino acid transporter 1-like isoform X2 [Tribolium madens]|uniref:b(0,+)-type amino acid transporter 1-like isoform X2 n=1 Tax=Tribolium madens TaxID=41895 RepID=UPI001CF73C05|nr:b(0,+)-type amino acid transporter 1-like isoform X2 [Tribolium madens]
MPRELLVELFCPAIVTIHKPLLIDGCDNQTIWRNSSLISLNHTSHDLTTGSKPFFIFRLSHHYQCLFGAIVMIIIGLIISHFTKRNNLPVDKMLFSPVIHRFLSETSTAEQGTVANINGDAKQGVQLKRELGLFSAINLILAVMIGSGIFVSPASALEHSGSVGMCLIVWTLCGIISLLGALAFAELGTVIPRSGAEYAYYMDAFGPLHKFWGHLPSFIYSWIMIVIIKPAEVAVIILTFSEYLCQPLLDLMCIQAESEEVKKAVKTVALLALGIITYINVSSVKLYVKVQNIFGGFKVFACLIVIFGGIYEIIKGNTDNLNRGFQGTKYTPKSIALAFYSGLWAYDGWSAVTVITEEIKRPEVNIPRSIMISVPIVTGLYVFMNMAYMTALSIPEMINSPAVAVTFGERVLGPMAFLIPLGVALATFGCALSIQFGVTRVCYAAGQDGLMIKSLSFVHYERLTPSFAVVSQGILSLLFIVAGDIVELIEFVSFLIWIFYGLAFVSLLVLRRTMRDAHRPYKVPTWICIFVLLIAIYLSVTPIVTDPTPKYLFALAFILLGVLVYYWFVYKKRTPELFMRKFTRFIQILFAAVPPDNPHTT